MEKIKLILRIWLFKYWYLLLLCISLSFGLYYYLLNTEQEKVYLCRLQGSTTLLSNASINDYMGSIIRWVEEKNYSNAERVLGVKKEIFERINSIDFYAQTIVEEQDIRYEFMVSVTAVDTTGFYILEEALMKRVSKHILLQDMYATKAKNFEKNKLLIENDLKRIDSIVSTVKEKNTVYFETLMQRKVDLKLQLSKIEEKFKEYYIIKKIQGFNNTVVVMKRTDSGEKVGLFKWLLMFLIIDFILVFVIDKQLRQLILS